MPTPPSLGSLKIETLDEIATVDLPRDKIEFARVVGELTREHGEFTFADAGDPVGDKGPAACAAALEEVLRGRRHTRLHGGPGHHAHEQCGEGERAPHQPDQYQPRQWRCGEVAPAGNAWRCTAVGSRADCSQRVLHVTRRNGPLTELSRSCLAASA
eukprot:9477472-Pyramimonas_sp.AAC.2